MTIRFEAVALAISEMNGAWDNPESRAFRLKNPGLLKTYRPEKKVDSEHYRIFTSIMGGFKALLADLDAKCSGKNHRLSTENTLRDMLMLYGINNDVAARKVLLFVRRALTDDSIDLNT